MAAELRGGIDYFGLPVEKRTASRAACDDFNRQHFQRLYDARGWSSARMISSRSKDGISSTVTPKVGHDPLLMRAWEAARTSRDLSRPATAQALDEQVRAKKELQDTMRALEAAEARAR